MILFLTKGERHYNRTNLLINLFHCLIKYLTVTIYVTSILASKSIIGSYLICIFNVNFHFVDSLIKFIDTPKQYMY